MNVPVPAGTTMPFERFWKWLKHHPNCILRAGSHDAWLWDHDDLHWIVDEGPDRRPYLRLARGKVTHAELVLDLSEVLFVQATVDSEEDGEQRWLFEVIAGDQGEPYALYHVVVAHGFADEEHAGGLKH